MRITEKTINWMLLSLLFGCIFMGYLTYKLLLKDLEPIETKKTMVGLLDLKLKGTVISCVKKKDNLYLSSIRVQNSKYKEYRLEKDSCFIRVKEGEAFMLTDHMIGSNLSVIVNENYNKKVIVLEKSDTLEMFEIKFFPCSDNSIWNNAPNHDKKKQTNDEKKSRNKGKSFLQRG